MKLERLTILVVILLAGCANQSNVNLEPTITDTPEAIIEPTPSNTPPPTATLTPTDIPEPTPVTIQEPFAGMKSPGPWMVFHTNKGTYIVSQDGSEVGLIPITEKSYYRSSEAAPSGGLIATYSMGLGITIGDLEIRRLTDNGILFSTYLGFDSQNTWEELDSQTKDDILLAVGSIGWSHNGKVLAFTGTFDSASSDLYTYNIENEILSQISDLGTQAVDFYWSPDDQYIYHADVKTLHGFKSGAGYSNWIYYLSTPDGDQTKVVFESVLGDERVWEKFIGWVSGTEALMYSHDSDCGYFDLRVIDILSGKNTSVYPGMVEDMEFDPNNSMTLVWVSPQESVLGYCRPELNAGLHLVSIPDGKIEQLIEPPSDASWFHISFDQNSGKFLIEGTASIQISVDGMPASKNINTGWAYIESNSKIETFEYQPLMSPDGKWIAFFELHENTLFIQNQVTEEITSLVVKEIDKTPIWGPDSRVLFLFQEHGLYIATAPNFEPKLILEDIGDNPYNPPIWVNP